MEMEGEIKERIMRDRSGTGAFGRVTKGRNVPVDVMRGLRNSILLPTLMYGS